MWALRRSGVVVIAALVVLSLTASAAAGSVTHVAGISYVEKTSVRHPGFTTLHSACPTATHVLSGGEWNQAPFGQVFVHHSYPVDGGDADHRPDDGWKVLLEASSKIAFSAYAVCADTRVTYVHKELAVAPSDQDGLYVQCPAGTHVVGGGSRGNRQLSEASSFPDESPPATWLIYMDNQYPQALPLTGYAICVHFSPDLVSLNSPNSTAQTYIAVPCPAGEHAISGGFESFSSFGTVALNSSLPRDGGDADSAPDDFWRSYVDVVGPNPVALRGYAVCVHKL